LTDAYQSQTMQLDDSAIAALGASLRAINPDLMQSGEDASAKRRIWYQGSEPYFDVTVEKLGKDITWFQVTLRGKVISWRLPNYLQTGETDELDVPPDVAYYAASKTIRDGERINWPLVESVQAIMACRPEDTVLSTINSLLQAQLDHRST
jgi:hypothetical protein